MLIREISINLLGLKEEVLIALILLAICLTSFWTLSSSDFVPTPRSLKAVDAIFRILLHSSPLDHKTPEIDSIFYKQYYICCKILVYFEGWHLDMHNIVNVFTC